jgi:hypothetical protein
MTSSWGWRVLRLAADLILMLLVGAAIWAAWLGWDHTYYYEAGAWHGPYRPSQVVACGVTVLVVAGLLALRWNPFVVAIGITVGFWWVWTLDAAGNDSSGLYVIGSILVMFGLAAGTALASTLGYVLRPLLHRGVGHGLHPPVAPDA